MLHFTVIAGPNGAGKSTFSTVMSRSSTAIFDPDKERLKIEKNFPDISDEAIESALTRKYEGFELQAVGGKKHITVETNLRNEYLVDRAELMKESFGYNTRLIFMMLPDIASSMDRVNLRVKQKGHFVDSENIKINFHKSSENLLRVVHRFDDVMLVCAASAFGIITSPKVLLTLKKNQVTVLAKEIPDWAMPVAQSVIELKTNVDRDRHYNHPKR